MAAGNVSQVSLFVCAAVEGALALILIIIVGVELGRHGETVDVVTTTTNVPSTTYAADIFSDAIGDEGVPAELDLQASQGISGELRAYYSVTVAILVSYIFLSVLILVGIKAEMKDLVKTHLDVNVVLSLIAVAVYIMAVASSAGISKYFVALMAFFLILRIVTITLEIRCHIMQRRGNLSGVVVAGSFVARSNAATVSVSSEVR